MNPSPSRRDFLATSGAAFGAWTVLNLPAIEAAAAYARAARARRQPFAVLDLQEARDLEAVAERIIPATDTPGARDAGVVYFMDRALESFASGLLETVRAGLADLNSRVRTQHPAASSFAELPQGEQSALLREIEQAPFFGAARFLTVAGMFAEPSYGGNRDHAGWKLIGLGRQAGYQPPFGYYDRAYGETGR